MALTLDDPIESVFVGTEVTKALRKLGVCTLGELLRFDAKKIQSTTEKSNHNYLRVRVCQHSLQRMVEHEHSGSPPCTDNSLTSALRQTAKKPGENLRKDCEVGDVVRVDQFRPEIFDEKQMTLLDEATEKSDLEKLRTSCGSISWMANQQLASKERTSQRLSRASQPPFRDGPVSHEVPMSVTREETKAIRLVEYLARVTALRTKIVRDVAEYTRILWVREIPEEKGCFTQAWGLDQEYDRDVWIEIQKRHEPELPSVPDICKDWVDERSIRSTQDLPELLSSITRQLENPAWKDGRDEIQFISRQEKLADHPEVQVAWDRFVELKWMPWAEDHGKWKKVHKVYSTLFNINQEQLRLGEEYELVIGLGLLTWQAPTSQRLKRHLIVANASLEFEARLGKFVVRPNPDGASLRPELDMLEEPPVRAEESAKETLKNAADDPWDRDCVTDVLKALIHSIDPNGEYRDCLESENPKYSDKPIVEYAPALILRKRSVRGLTEVLRRIKERIERGEYIPREFADLAEISTTGHEMSLEKQDYPAAQPDGEIYFPKPSNQEQRVIVHKIRASSGVLVQGPPGTGKSHTIANLVCHLLASGERTLITAKTPRALQVIEQLLPKDLRPLCINLLGTGLEEKRSLEKSVDTILRKNETWNQEQAREEIASLTRGLEDFRREKAAIDNRLRSIRESETFSHAVASGAYRGTAAQIARALKSDESQYGWFSDPAPLDKSCPTTANDLLKVLEVLRTLTPQRRNELGLDWPESLPNRERFEDLVVTERDARDKENDTASNADDDLLQRLSSLGEDDLRSIEGSFSELQNRLERVQARPNDWVKDAIRDVTAGNASFWQELKKETEQMLSSVADAVHRANDTDLGLPQDHDPKAVLEDCLALRDHLVNGGKFGWGPFRPKPVKSALYIVKSARVNGRLCDNLERITSLSDVLNVQITLDSCWHLWSGRCEKKQDVYTLQFHYLESQVSVLNEVFSLLDKIQHCREALALCGSLPEPPWHEESRIKTFVQTCVHATHRKRRLQAANELQRLEAPVGELAAKTDAHPVTHECLKAIRTRDVDGFARVRAKIEDLHRHKTSVIKVEDYLKKLRKIVPNLARHLEKDCNDACLNERIRQIADAWGWAQARTWLHEFIRQEDAPSLAIRARQIEDQIGEIIAKIASIRAWEFCFGRMHEDHRRHMEAWRQSMQKLGKGTGKHAPRRRREAQGHLNNCREAVPSWVLPLHRLWDTVDPAPGIFDVIIVDEASQCGLEALPLLYLGKKILIVGDDKQISPDAVGIPRDTVHRLMEEFLFDFRFKSSFDIESSLFDHGKLRYGTGRVTLREHFRCMPEIIGFSNDLCYSDTPLIPLRQYGPDRLPPLVHVHLQNGYREGSENRVINRPEAEAIVAKIVDLCRDPNYRDKSMGVVVLQGEAQAGLIEDQLFNQLGAEEIRKRKLVCGNPYSFQGDERDIMFLSMVAAANERIGPFTKPADERRFNVAASRARDQMWLFHAVTQDDLSDSCLRKRLLRFFEETKQQEIGGIDRSQLERQANQANRNVLSPPDPFDSWFEVDVILKIAARGYHVIPQFHVGGKRIDLVVEGGSARLAVECDGDEFHGEDRYEQDMDRQRMLERCGWNFFRIRASAFYANREDALLSLWSMLEERGIEPNYHESSASEKPDLPSGEQQSDGASNSSNSGELKRPVQDQASTSKSEIVEVGDTVGYVKVKNPDSELQVRISPNYSKPEWGMVTPDAPIAQALLGASIGEVVEATLPTGVVRLRIKQISKGS